MRFGILASHPIQYQSPWFRALANRLDLHVFFAHRQTAQQQAQADFGIEFEWDVDLHSGYEHTFLRNVSKKPSVNHFFGCDTPEITEIIEAGHFDGFILMGWFLKSYWQAVRACRRVGVPLLVRGDSQLLTPRSLIKQFAKKIIYPRVFRKFDIFLAVGKRSTEYLRHYGVPSNRIFFAPHAVDNDRLATRANKAQGRRTEMRYSWGVNDNTLVVLFVGKFIPIKRPSDILYALTKLRTFGIPTVAIFVGAGELEPLLRAEALSLGVRVNFAGFVNQSELPDYYAAADVLVLPSATETWGLVVNEAMACGLPAIVADSVGCAPDLIEEGKTGFAYPTGDSAQLAQRLRELFEMKQTGYDFRPMLADKMREYSIAKAVAGTVKAVETLTQRDG